MEIDGVQECAVDIEDSGMSQGISSWAERDEALSAALRVGSKKKSPLSGL
jgi:hypothetical protein